MKTSDKILIPIAVAFFLLLPPVQTAWGECECPTPHIDTGDHLISTTVWLENVEILDDEDDGINGETEILIYTNVWIKGHHNWEGVFHYEDIDMDSPNIPYTIQVHKPIYSHIECDPASDLGYKIRVAEDDATGIPDVLEKIIEAAAKLKYGGKTGGVIAKGVIAGLEAMMGWNGNDDLGTETKDNNPMPNSGSKTFKNNTPVQGEFNYEIIARNDEWKNFKCNATGLKALKDQIRADQETHDALKKMLKQELCYGGVGHGDYPMTRNAMQAARCFDTLALTVELIEEIYWEEGKDIDTTKADIEELKQTFRDAVIGYSRYCDSTIVDHAQTKGVDPLLIAAAQTEILTAEGFVTGGELVEAISHFKAAWLILGEATYNIEVVSDDEITVALDPINRSDTTVTIPFHLFNYSTKLCALQLEVTDSEGWPIELSYGVLDLDSASYNLEPEIYLTIPADAPLPFINTLTLVSTDPILVGFTDTSYTVVTYLWDVEIAFETDRDENLEIYMMNEDGSVLQNLTNHPANDFSPSLCLTAGKVAFASDRDGDAAQIFTTNTDGTDVIQLTFRDSDFDDDPAFSPDGTKIAFMSILDYDPDIPLEDQHDREIFVMNADGSELTNLTNTAGNVEDIHPTWSPDGSQITFGSDRDGDFEVYIMDAVTGDIIAQLTDNTTGEAPTSWSANGKIAFTSGRDGNAEVYVMDADGSNQTNLTNSPECDDGMPSWSPDGIQIAFETDRNGNTDLYKMDADGSNQQQLTANPAWDAEPCWDVSLVGIEEEKPSERFSGFSLATVSPNPFIYSTRINYTVPHPSHVSLKIYNVAGELIQTLVDSKEDAGSKSVVWDGRDRKNARVSSGIYFVCLATPARTLTQKVVLLSK